MRALDERRRRFVVALVLAGTCDATQAARAAGYSAKGPGTEYLRVQGCRLMGSDAVRAAIQEESSRVLKGGAPVAIKALLDVAGDPEHKDRYKAAADILDRIGYPKLSIQQHDVTVKDERTNEELLGLIKAKVLELAERGVALPKPEVIEGEVVEVTSGQAA